MLEHSMWKQWTNAMLGLAVVILAFYRLLSLSASFTWVLVAFGIIISVLAICSTNEVIASEDTPNLIPADMDVIKQKFVRSYSQSRELLGLYDVKKITIGRYTAEVP